jgi:hypothetical protein
MVSMTNAATTPEVTTLPANEASWEDLEAVLGGRSTSRGARRLEAIDDHGAGEGDHLGRVTSTAAASSPDAGFIKVSRPTLRPVVMHTDF